jgi:ubiquinone/menaquinone biosynthesis C-methylase UbiE/DNA-binding transcriptional ArsR family regulator
LQELLNQLRAVAEPTRLRILVALEGSELTVSELTQVLDQSQPRVSRHLKLLTDAGLLERYAEGSWAFYRLTSSEPGSRLIESVFTLIDRREVDMARDQRRLEHLRRENATRAHAYFSDVASSWDKVGRLHVAEREVEKAILSVSRDLKVDTLVDLGTGTGRMLEIFAGQVSEAIGVDSNRDMLSAARGKLAQQGHRHVQLRQADITDVPFQSEIADLVTIHQVLHYLDDPSAAVSEAARLLKTGGMLVVVDFAPHEHERLRSEFAHRRLGFREEEIVGLCRSQGLDVVAIRRLKSKKANRSKPLTVVLWAAVRQK